MSDIAYSHRPTAGISVGAFSNGSQLFVAFALTNNGLSRNGLFWKDRQDAFSRAIARSILNGRIENGDTIMFKTDMSARQFMAEFRKLFKPTVDESDDTFSFVEPFGGIEIRSRMLAKQIRAKLVSMVEQVVKSNASIRENWRNKRCSS